MTLCNEFCLFNFCGDGAFLTTPPCLPDEAGGVQHLCPTGPVSQLCGKVDPVHRALAGRLYIYVQAPNNIKRLLSAFSTRSTLDCPSTPINHHVEFCCHIPSLSHPGIIVDTAPSHRNALRHNCSCSPCRYHTFSTTCSQNCYSFTAYSQGYD